MIILSERERERVALPFNSAILLGSVWGGVIYLFFIRNSVQLQGKTKSLKQVQEVSMVGLMLARLVFYRATWFQ